MPERAEPVAFAASGSPRADERCGQLVWTLAAAARGRCIEIFTMSALGSNARIRSLLR